MTFCKYRSWGSDLALFEAFLGSGLRGIQLLTFDVGPLVNCVNYLDVLFANFQNTIIPFEN
jgi:hypothetical protein